jgi:homoserine dehydrogenase
MSALRINIILFGIGNVGSTLVNQVIESQKFFLEKRNIDLRFPIITNSTLAFFEKDGLKNQWEANFAQSAIPFRIEDIIEYVQEQQLENNILDKQVGKTNKLKHNNINQITTKTKWETTLKTTSNNKTIPEEEQQ